MIILLKRNNMSPIFGAGLSTLKPTYVRPTFKANESWDLDGTNDYINFGNSSSIKLSDTDTSEAIGITVHGWVKLDDYTVTGKTQSIVHCYEYPGGWHYGFTNTRAYVTVRTTGAARSFETGWRTFSDSSGNAGTSPHYRASGWHQLAFTYDGRYIKLYIDGGLAGSGTNTYDAGSDDNIIQYGTGNDNTDVLIGADPGHLNSSHDSGSAVGGASFLSGLVNEVAIWNKALDGDAIQEIFDSVDDGNGVLDLTIDYGNYDYSNDLVALWRGNEADGNTVTDEIGSNPGTLANGTAYSSTTPS